MTRRGAQWHPRSAQLPSGILWLAAPERNPLEDLVQLCSVYRIGQLGELPAVSLGEGECRLPFAEMTMCYFPLLVLKLELISLLDIFSHFFQGANKQREVSWNLEKDPVLKT